MPSSTDGEETTMTSSTRIPPAEITGLFGLVAKRMSKKLLGEVPEPLGVMWHNQRVLKAFFGFSSKAEKWDTCDRQLKSFAHMATVSPQLGAPGLVELTAFIGAANLVSRTNVALGIKSQEFSTTCGLQPLATPTH
jgi:hypothetical protein